MVSGGAQKLYDEVTSLGIPVDQLVNNAGAGKQGLTVEADQQSMTDLLHLLFFVQDRQKPTGRKTPHWVCFQQRCELPSSATGKKD